MNNPQEMGLPAYQDIYPKSKWYLSQKVAWSLIIGLLALSITLGSYIIYDTVKRANEEPFEKLMVEEKAKFLDKIIYEFPSMREKLIDFAVMKNEYQWVDTLLWSNARHFHLDSNKSPPLIVATQNDNPEIVQNLLEYGYDVNEKDTVRGYWSSEQNWTAIFEAAKKPDSKVLEILIKYGANVTQRDMTGFTPLHIAAKENNTKNVEILIQNGAETNVTNIPNFTPLLYALWQENVEMVRALLEHGADPTIPKDDPYSGRILNPLTYARYREKDLVPLLEHYVTITKLN